jgi:hypothetical protein
VRLDVVVGEGEVDSTATPTASVSNNARAARLELLGSRSPDAAKGGVLLVNLRKRRLPDVA